MYKFKLRYWSVFQHFIYLALIIFPIFIFSYCEKRDFKAVAKILNDTVLVSDSGITVKAEIIDLGTGITDYGHCWSVNPLPTIVDPHSSFGIANKTGSIESFFSLRDERKYYFRAYLISDNQVFYSDTLSYGNYLPEDFNIISPSHEDNIFIGSTYRIKWNFDRNIVLSIKLYRNKTLIENIAENIHNTGQFEWDVSTKLDTAANYFLAIFNNDEQIIEYSQFFNIVKKNILNTSYASLEGGTFEMGSNSGNDDERPIHMTQVYSFNMSKYEITNNQFAEFLTKYGGEIISKGMYVGKMMIDFEGKYKNEKCRIVKKNNKYTVQSGFDDYPVSFVTWYGAYEFCRFYGGRLPTEAEWEFAARGGSKSLNFIYSGSNDPQSVGWCITNSGNKLHHIGEKPANEAGFFDMSGNIWEWCNDWYDSKYYIFSPILNPQGPFQGTFKVRRGGCWDYTANSMRVSQRGNSRPNEAFSVVGFRFVTQNQ